MPTKLRHGCYGREIAVDINMHKYVGGEGGYCEMLEIVDPPKGRGQAVINQYGIGAGYKVWEYSSIEGALTAWPGTFPPAKDGAMLSKGCLGMHGWSGPGRIPWFYAHSLDDIPQDDFYITINPDPPPEPLRGIVCP